MLTNFSSFGLFIIRDKTNRNYLLVAAVAIVLQITIFKWLYPYADFFSDSYSYIYAAASGQDVSIWPIGYSKFLLLFHNITHSDTALIIFQYLFIEVMSLYFFFAILYFYKPAAQTSLIIYIFLLFNPVSLYLSNYVASDGLFLGIGLLWIVQLLWILHRPQPYQIFTHALLVAIAFAIRYNAIYYPIITAIAYMLSSRKLTFKIAGIILPLILIALFVTHTRKENYKVTGTMQFSVFGGWQLANNALYMYPFIQVKERPPAECRQFHVLVDNYFNNIPASYKNISPKEGAVYIKMPKAPLKQYLAQYAKDGVDTTGGVSSWGKVAPVYGSYGKFLILNHPFAFARYFLLPNAANYFLPPLEKLEVYNLGSDEVSPIAQSWFHYPSTTIRVISHGLQGGILFLFPSIFLAINLFFIWILVRWLYFNKLISNTQRIKYPIILITALLTVNSVFSILASPVVFRYQVLPMIVCFSFAMLLKGQWDASTK